MQGRAACSLSGVGLFLKSPRKLYKVSLLSSGPTDRPAGLPNLEAQRNAEFRYHIRGTGRLESWLNCLMSAEAAAGPRRWR